VEIAVRINHRVHISNRIRHRLVEFFELGDLGIGHMLCGHARRCAFEHRSHGVELT